MSVAIGAALTKKLNGDDHLIGFMVMANLVRTGRP